MNIRMPIGAALALAIGVLCHPALAQTEPAAAPPGAAPSSPAPATDGPPPVRIGILSDASGPYAAAGGAGNVIAARLAVADYGGKVLGRPIELIDADHKNDPAVGSAILTQWFDQGGVEAVAGSARRAWRLPPRRSPGRATRPC